jgi:hypothetical protein
MGVTLSRKYHYLLRTEMGRGLSIERRKQMAHAVTDMKNVTEADLPVWVQDFIRDTQCDPARLN